MAQPPAYNREKNFTLNSGRETDHSALNAELDRASNSINDIRTNLAILQADDGKLRPAVVTADSISEELRVSLVEGVVMDAQSMLDKSLAAAEASAASAAEIKTCETVCLASKSIAVESANSARKSAEEAAISAGKAKQVNADWNATDGYAQILNKPSTLAGLELVDIHTRVKSTAYFVGDIVNAPYIHDAILVCTTEGTTSDEELGEDSISVGSDIDDGTVVWNVRNKFSTGLKRVEGTVSLDSHASQTGEYGGGNEQYFGHVKVVDDCFSNKLAADSVALSPYGAITAINNVMLGKTAGTITSSTNWTCPVSGNYTFTLVGGGGGGGGGSYNVYYEYSSGTRAASGGGGGGGGAGEVKTVSLNLEKEDVVEIVIGGGGTGGNGGIGTTDTRKEHGQPGVTGQSGGNTSVSVSGTMHTAVGGGGGEGASGPTIANKNNIGGGGGAAGIHHSVGDAPARGTNGVGATSLAASIGGNGGKGGISGTSSIYSRYGNGGGGGAGKGYSTYGNAGYAQTLAQSGNGGNGGNGAQGMVHIILEAI